MEAYRVRLVREHTKDIEGKTPWTEIESHVFIVYDDDPNGGFSTSNADGGSKKFFDGEIRDREKHSVRGGKGTA